MTVNIRLLLTFMVACLPFLTAFADNVDEIKAQINKVKKRKSPRNHTLKREEAQYAENEQKEEA